MKAVLIILGLAAVGAVAFIVIRNMNKTPAPVAATAPPQGSLKDALAGLAIEGAVYGGKKLIEGGEYLASKGAQGAVKVVQGVEKGAELAGSAISAGASAVADAFVGDINWQSLSDSALDLYIRRRNEGNAQTIVVNHMNADKAQAEKDRRAKVAADAYLAANPKTFAAQSITALAGKNTALTQAGGMVATALQTVKANPAPAPSAADIAAASAAASAANAGAAASKAQAVSVPINTPPTATKTPSAAVSSLTTALKAKVF